MAARVPVSTLVVAILATFLALPSAAQAQGEGVWIDCRHGNAFCTKDFSQAISVWQSMGAEVMVTTELDFDQVVPANYRLLIIMLPTPGPAGECEPYGDYLSPFCNQEIEMLLPNYLSLGGRIVLLADNESDDPSVSDEAAGNNGIRQILDSLAPDLVLNEDRINSNCETTTNIVADTLTVGLTGWDLAQVNTVTGGQPLIQFARSDGGGLATLATVKRFQPDHAGEIVLFGDVEGFLGSCLNPANQTALWQNLYSDQSSAPDNDNDGVTTAEGDCDDTDETIHPGATENCDNLVDDDCDDLIDAEDPDCSGDDDDTSAGDDDTADDDDSTPGGFGDDDDDDTVGEFGDDNYSPGEWGGGCCGTSTYNDENQAVLSLALFCLGMGFLRSRNRET